MADAPAVGQDGAGPRRQPPGRPLEPGARPPPRPPGTGTSRRARSGPARAGEARPPRRPARRPGRATALPDRRRPPRTGPAPGRPTRAEHPADHLALEGRRVEAALAGHHQVGLGQSAGQPDQLGHQVEAGDQAARPGRPAPRPARRPPGSGQRVDVDPEAQVAAGQLVEAGGQGRHLGGGGALLRAEDLGRPSERRDHVAGHHQLGPAAAAPAAPMASTAPHPPSVVADPPTPTTTRRAPAPTAARISWPTPAVEARTGSSPAGEGRGPCPPTRADSITAVGP